MATSPRTRKPSRWSRKRRSGAVRIAEADVRRQQRELIEARIKLDRRLRTGRKAVAEGRVPKIVANARKREAQVSAGKLRTGHEADLAEARERLEAAERAVRDDAGIRVVLPGTEVPAGRTVLVCEAARAPWLRTGVDLEIRRPERIALLGANGAGKTTVLRMIAGELAADAAAAAARRAHRQPGHGERPAGGAGTGRVPRGAAGRQPRLPFLRAGSPAGCASTCIPDRARSLDWARCPPARDWMPV